MKEAPATDATARVYRWAYGLFVLLSAYFLYRGDVASAASNLGIALIFDPFDPSRSWTVRPRWQRTWLIVHVLLVLAGFTFLLL